LLPQLLEGINTVSSFAKERVMLDPGQEIRVECTATHTRGFGKGGKLQKQKFKPSTLPHPSLCPTIVRRLSLRDSRCHRKYFVLAMAALPSQVFCERRCRVYFVSLQRGLYLHLPTSILYLHLPFFFLFFLQKGGRTASGADLWLTSGWAVAW
jgi:hypothetical protein